MNPPTDMAIKEKSELEVVIAPSTEEIINVPYSVFEDQIMQYFSRVVDSLFERINSIPTRLLSQLRVFDSQLETLANDFEKSLEYRCIPVRHANGTGNFSIRDIANSYNRQAEIAAAKNKSLSVYPYIGPDFSETLISILDAGNIVFELSDDVEKNNIDGEEFPIVVKGTKITPITQDEYEEGVVVPYSDFVEQIYKAVQNIPHRTLYDSTYSIPKRLEKLVKISKSFIEQPISNPRVPLLGKMSIWEHHDNLTKAVNSAALKGERVGFYCIDRNLYMYDAKSDGRKFISNVVSPLISKLRHSVYESTQISYG